MPGNATQQAWSGGGGPGFGGPTTPSGFTTGPWPPAPPGGFTPLNQAGYNQYNTGQYYNQSQQFGYDQQYWQFQQYGQPASYGYNQGYDDQWYDGGTGYPSGQQRQGRGTYGYGSGAGGVPVDAMDSLFGNLANPDWQGTGQDKSYTEPEPQVDYKPDQRIGDQSSSENYDSEERTRAGGRQGRQPLQKEKSRKATDHRGVPFEDMAKMFKVLVRCAWTLEVIRKDWFICVQPYFGYQKGWQI